MTRALKVFGIVIAVIVLILVIASIAMTYLIDPNKYKDKIDHYVYKKTGRHLLIKGNIGLSFFPWLGIDIKSAQLTNPEGFTPRSMADIGELDLKVRALPLIGGDVRIGEIAIKNATFNLITRKDGATNWSAAKPAPANNTATNASSQTTSSAKTDSNNESDTEEYSPEKNFEINRVRISNATINLINEQENSTIKFSKFNLTAKHITVGKKFPISANFIVQQSGAQSKTKTRITGDATVNLDSGIYRVNSLEINNKTTRPKLPVLPFNINGNLMVNTHKETLTLDKANVVFANMKLNGNLKVNQLFHIPETTLNLATVDTDVNTLLTTLRGSSFLQGSLDFKTSLTAKGETKKEFLSTLNGSGNFVINKGVLKGVDINYLMAKAASLLDKSEVKAQNTKVTNFSDISASYSINNGVLTCNDLKLASNQVNVTGAGNVNLPNDVIDYELTAQYSSGSAQGVDKSLSLPIKVSGPMAKPTIYPDFSKIAKSYFMKNLEKSIKDGSKDLGKKIRSFFD